MHIIQTSRLILTPYAEADRAHVVALHGDPVVMDYMKDSRPLTEAEATQEHARYLHAWARDGFGIFTVRNCADDQLIGRVTGRSAVIGRLIAASTTVTTSVLFATGSLLAHLAIALTRTANTDPN